MPPLPPELTHPCWGHHTPLLETSHAPCWTHTLHACPCCTHAHMPLLETCVHAPAGLITYPCWSHHIHAHARQRSELPTHGMPVRKSDTQIQKKHIHAPAGHMPTCPCWTHRMPLPDTCARAPAGHITCPCWSHHRPLPDPCFTYCTWQHIPDMPGKRSAVPPPLRTPSAPSLTLDSKRKEPCPLLGATPQYFTVDHFPRQRPLF